MTGGASVAKKDMNHQPEPFIVVTILEGENEVCVLTPKTALRFASIAINTNGGMVTNVMITKHTWSNVWGNKDLNSLGLELTNKVTRSQLESRKK